MDILIIMIIGILFGSFIIKGKGSKILEKIQTISCLLLIFLLGISLGKKDNFFSDLSNLGIDSFIFFIVPTFFSVLVVYLLTRKKGA